MLTYVAILDRLMAQLSQLKKNIEDAVERIPAGRIIMSFPRAGKVNAAQILSEFGEDPQRFPTAKQLSAEAGVVPVTYQSGKHRRVGFRWACNKRLRNYATNYAGNSRHQSPWAADLYARSRARGHDHPHAVRIVARAWLRVMWRCWRDGVEYDPLRHGAARGFLTAA